MIGFIQAGRILNIEALATVVKCKVRGLQILLWLGLVAVMLGSAGQPRAEECQLKSVASINFQRTVDGRIRIPISVDDHPLQFILDTGSADTSILTESAANALNLKLFETNLKFYGSAGQTIDHGANAKNLVLGQLHIEKTQFLISPGGETDDPGISGRLGPEFIRQFDLDIDSAANKLQLFSQDHCPGQVVYWTKGWVDSPIKVLRSGHVTIDVQLDGKTVTALLDTGVSHTILAMHVAYRLFGLDQNSPDIVESKSSDPYAGAKFQYRFHTLSFAGIVVNNPNVFLLEDKIKPIAHRDNSFRTFPNDEEARLPDCLIGMDVLSKLHFYIAYGEQHFYASAAGAH